MKIIDLLNKIANGEEVPEKIKYKSTVLCFKEVAQDYDGYGGGYLFEYLFKEYDTDSFINDEVEIIEEPKKIENIDFDIDCPDRDLNIGELYDKLNEIIDYINKDKSDET